MQAAVRTTRLGPATLLEASPGRVRIALDDSEVDARWAIASPYRPQAGDVVLAISQDDEHYVIGVLSGTGETVLTAPGDLKLYAPRGAIEIVSTKGVSIRGPEVSVRAGRLQLAARSAFERFTMTYTRVRDLVQVRAGRSRTVVDSTHTVMAERIVSKAKEDVRIDGQQIRLG